MSKLLLLGIVISALLLRTVSIGQLPYGFTPDEASFAYDAYSLILTGRDQWGKQFPVMLESFGDFKAPLLSYLAIPFVLMSGLTKEAVRLPNALLATASIVVVYLLAGEMADFAKLSNRGKKIFQFSASVLLAISPWHIMLSRGGFEANLTTFFMPLGMLLFFYGVKKGGILTLSALIFGLNLFTYHAARLITPMMVLMLIVLFGKELKKIGIRKLLPAVLTFFLFISLSGITMLVGGISRAKDINIFNGSLEVSAEDRYKAILSGLPLGTARIFHNKYTVTAERFLSNYVQYFSPAFLYSSGPAEATYGMVPGSGVDYWFSAPLIIFAFLGFIKIRERRIVWVILFWILASPIPASLAQGRGFAANRAAVMIPGLQLLLAFGVYSLGEFYSKKLSQPLKLAAATLYSLVIIFSFTGFLENYFIMSPYKVAEAMLYGNLETAQVLEKIADRKAKIIVSKSLSEPHIYVAFAGRYNPSEYQRQAREWNYTLSGVNWVDQIPQYQLGKYIFKSLDWTQDSLQDAYLVGKPSEFPASVNPLAVIRYPDSRPAIYIVDPRSSSFAYANN